MNAPAPNSPPRPLRPLLGLALLSVPLMLGTLGFAFRYTQEWWEMRAFRDPVQRRMAMQGPSYFRADYLDGVERLKAVIPEDAKVLVEIGEQRILMVSNRWHLLLNNDLYPREVYTRAPEFAGATLVEYTEWLRIQKRPVAALPLRDQLEFEQALNAAGIEWWLIQPLTQRYLIDEVVLKHRVGARWEEVPIPELEAPLPDNPWKQRKQRREAEEREDDFMPELLPRTGAQSRTGERR